MKEKKNNKKKPTNAQLNHRGVVKCFFIVHVDGAQQNFIIQFDKGRLCNRSKSTFT